LTTVYDGILDDLVLPSTIVGRRIRYRLDGTKFIKIYLDQADKDVLDDNKIDVITSLYKKLTTREIAIEFKEDKPFYTLKK